MLGLATCICEAFHALNFTEANIVTVYIIGVLVASLFTQNYVCNVISSLAAVLLFNFLFTEPRFSLYAYSSGYPVTFIIMLSTSLIIGSLAVRLRMNSRLSARSAYRTKIFFETNMLFQGVQNEDEVYDITASQLVKLLNRDIVVYRRKENNLDKYKSYNGNEQNNALYSEADISTAEACLQKSQPIIVESGKEPKCSFFPVCKRDKKFGVIGIDLQGRNLDSLDKSIVNSIIGECALAIDNIRNSIEKEKQTVQAKNEQLRANLLRTISHDLRTPLTAISGNAEYLLTYDVKPGDATATQIYTDIYNDSSWLNELVENLLEITRLENGRLSMNFTSELMEDIINEAVGRIKLKKSSHELSVCIKDELLLVKADARFIVQVIFNLVDNAVKHTPSGTKIEITAQKRGDNVSVSVADNGNGIADIEKEKIFEMFYTENDEISDSRRSLGLGLPLCKTIIEIHNGILSVSDNYPHGSIFTFSLPIEEVSFNE